MGNTHPSTQRRSTRPDSDSQWNQTYPRPRAWVQPQPVDAYQPYSSPARSRPHFTHKLMMNNGMNQAYVNNNADHLPYYGRYAMPVPESVSVQKIKVLPVTTAPPKLRATDNGLALQKAGTISNRKLIEQPSSPMLKHQKEKLQHHEEVMVESEASVSPDHMGSRRTKVKKKYKAPPVPATSDVSTVETPDVQEIRDVTKIVSSQSSKYSPQRLKNHETLSDSEMPASVNENRPTGSAGSRNKRDNLRKLRIFKTKSDSKQKSDVNQLRARSMEYIASSVANETQEVRHSREDISFIGLGTGPVTVFSSQKQLDKPENEWDEPDFQRKNGESHKLEVRREAQKITTVQKSNAQRTVSNDADPSKKQQFYFGATPGDIAVTTLPNGGRSSTADLDEESRRVMEEFDAILTERKMEMSPSPRPDKERTRPSKNHRKSPPPPVAPSPPTSSKKKETRKSGKILDDEDDISNIDLHLRPTLPKKPLQLPRFSPSAAWRALGNSTEDDSSVILKRRDVSHHQKCSAIQQQFQSSKGSEISEDEDVFEERITKNARPVAPLPPRLANEKSADSGISGDAGSPDAMLHPINDKPLAMSSPVPHHHHAANWTPEQDLGESSNEADNTDSRSSHRRKSRSNTPPKIIPKSQMFPGLVNDSAEMNSRSSTLSKGRKYRKKSDLLMDSVDSSTNTPQKYNSLRKLKRSVSGAFAAVALRSRSKSPDVRSVNENDNWVLSRSAPNSVLNGSEPTRKCYQKFYRSEADISGELGVVPLSNQFPAYSQPIITQRIVYLPQYDSKKLSSYMGSPQDRMKRAKSADAVFLQSNHFDSPCMFDASDFQTSTPKALPPSQRAARRFMGKKFTFQSTVRLQEKKLLEEKLSREAEEKERRRLQEIQAMERVEEEFQRKRAREKANIREQLRLLHIQSNKIRREPPGNPAQRINDPLVVNKFDNRSSSSDRRYVTPNLATKTRLDPEGAPAPSHSKSSSDEYRREPHVKATDHSKREMVRKDEPAVAINGTSQENDSRNRNHKTSSNSFYRRQGQGQTTQPTDSSHKQQQFSQQSPDIRKEMPSSSKLRSDKSSPSLEQSNHSKNKATARQPTPKQDPIVPERKKSIYKRLAEITSEEESIASPPPLISLNKNLEKPGQSSKMMTQELSEYRQEQREYRDYRSPRHYPPSSHQSSTPSGRSPRTPTSSSSVSDNYRWDFAHGVAPGSRPIKPAWQHNFTRDYHRFLSGSE